MSPRVFKEIERAFKEAKRKLDKYTLQVIMDYAKRIASYNPEKAKKFIEEYIREYGHFLDKKSIKELQDLIKTIEMRERLKKMGKRPGEWEPSKLLGKEKKILEWELEILPKLRKEQEEVLRQIGEAIEKIPPWRLGLKRPGEWSPEEFEKKLATIIYAPLEVPEVTTPLTQTTTSMEQYTVYTHEERTRERLGEWLRDILAQHEPSPPVGTFTTTRIDIAMRYGRETKEAEKRKRRVERGELSVTEAMLPEPIYTLYTGILTHPALGELEKELMAPREELRRISPALSGAYAGAASLALVWKIPHYILSSIEMPVRASVEKEYREQLIRYYRTHPGAIVEDVAAGIAGTLLGLMLGYYGGKLVGKIVSGRGVRLADAEATPETVRARILRVGDKTYVIIEEHGRLHVTGIRRLPRGKVKYYGVVKGRRVYGVIDIGDSLAIEQVMASVPEEYTDLIVITPRGAGAGTLAEVQRVLGLAGEKALLPLLETETKRIPVNELASYVRGIASRTGGKILVVRRLGSGGALEYIVYGRGGYTRKILVVLRGDQVGKIMELFREAAKKGIIKVTPSGDIVVRDMRGYVQLLQRLRAGGVTTQYTLVETPGDSIAAVVAIPVKIHGREATATIVLHDPVPMTVAVNTLHTVYSWAPENIRKVIVDNFARLIEDAFRTVGKPITYSQAIKIAQEAVEKGSEALEETPVAYLDVLPVEITLPGMTLLVLAPAWRKPQEILRDIKRQLYIALEKLVL